MTERLRQLMHDEAGSLTPPTPDAATVLAEGRRLRHRSRITTGVAAVAVAAVVVTTAGFVALNTGDSGAKDPGPAGSAAVDAAPPAYGVGSDIHLGDVVAQVPDSVHSLHYTSLGVLVRSNPNDGNSDGSGPESLTLVRWDGTTADLGTIPEGVGPATDPERDVYVLAEAVGDGFVAAVRDAATGNKVEEVPLPDLPKSYWDVPPLSLDGDTLYVGYRDETVTVDLTTGEQTPAAGLNGGLPEVHGGRTVFHSIEAEVVSVLDARNGEELFSVDVLGSGSLSPDGEYLQLLTPGTSMFGRDTSPFEVFDVDSGSSVTIQEPADGWGWTADGGLFKVEGDTLTTCDAATGECEESPLSQALPKNAFPRLGGRLYES
ncbi:MAG: hypothetical protein WKF50_04050 [Nocardioides sp.]